eukprot:scaffold4400_cov124-Isochrysis_galbana.AAC.2
MRLTESTCEASAFEAERVVLAGTWSDAAYVHMCSIMTMGLAFPDEPTRKEVGAREARTVATSDRHPKNKIP